MDILLTGAAGGIGAATTRRLTERGHRVFAVDLQKMRSISPELHIPLTMDVTDPKSIEEVHLRISAETDGLDALVNNAGWFDQFPLVEAEPGQFEKIISVNVLAAQRTVHAFFPLLYRRRGRVINVSSESALALMPLQSYGMTKRMLDAYTEVLRQELALLDMKVITVRPGAHLTPFIDRSIEVLGQVNDDSLYRNALSNVRKEGGKILHAVSRDPMDVASAITTAIEANRPKREYWVNVSWNFRILSILPRRWREALFKVLLSRTLV